MFELTGRIAIVTGAAGGLGSAIAKCYSKQGAKVALVDLPGVSMDKTIEMCKEAGCDDILHVEMDLRDEQSIKDGVAKVKEHYGRIDILAANAGLNKTKPAVDVDGDWWDAVLDVNLRGSFLIAKIVAPIMMENEFGRIIFTASQAGLVAREDQTPYCASKGGIISMTRALAYDWAKKGITVNSVAPSFALTELTRSRLENPEYNAMVVGMIPRGRVIMPDEVGAAFTYLASDEATMVTGHTLVIDGGWTIW